LLQLKKEELKEEARKRFLPIHGNKIDLVFILKPFTRLHFSFHIPSFDLSPLIKT
jgi:hypothetical protein